MLDYLQEHDEIQKRKKQGENLALGPDDDDDDDDDNDDPITATAGMDPLRFGSSTAFFLKKGVGCSQ